MIDLNEIFSRPTTSAISALKAKSVTIPNWEKLLDDYDPQRHRIVTDKVERKAQKQGGKYVEPARIAIPYEKLLTSRMAEFCFSIPVQRNYPSLTDEDGEIKDAIERIYKSARVDSQNIERSKQYFASCEVCSIWYTKQETNSLYGFPSDYKLKVASYSPMEGYKLYPLFDETGDLLAMSIEYKRKVMDEEVHYFETYTADRHIKWRTNGIAKVLLDEKIALGKIPSIYMWRHEPIFKDITNFRSEIEWTLSRNSDIVANNAAPILKVSGQLMAPENKDRDKATQIVQTEQGGDVNYVTWPQASDAVQYNVETLEAMIFKVSQMPDISFANMSKLGNIGYDARRTLLTDAHLKVGDESGKLLEFLDREVNVIKAFLKLLRPDWAKRLDGIEIVNEITPFVQNDETEYLERILKANGQKAVISQKESITLAGYSSDASKTLAEIQEEEASASEGRMNNILGGESYN